MSTAAFQAPISFALPGQDIYLGAALLSFARPCDSMCALMNLVLVLCLSQFGNLLPGKTFSNVTVENVAPITELLLCCIPTSIDCESLAFDVTWLRLDALGLTQLDASVT